MNQAWADLLVEELVRNGVDTFFLAPGSRSTPLTVAVARHAGTRHLVHFDERGTAFAALGYGRAKGHPAAWITTSGTAVANGLPAVVEAATDGVPMVLLTADRPPELRQTGANQTVDQPGIFGRYVRWQFDLPVPAREIDAAMVLTTVDQAVYRSLRHPAGPVHLNCMFREPLSPSRQTPAVVPPARWRQSDAPYTRYLSTEGSPGEEGLETLAEALRGLEDGIVVAGRLGTPAQGIAVRNLAAALGWPLLPDIGSQARLGGDTGHTVPYYDLLLACDDFAASHAPPAVLHVGRRSTSKRLMLWLDRARPAVYAVVDETPFRLDPRHHVTHRMEAAVVPFCRSLTETIDAVPADRSRWTRSWMAADKRVRTLLDGYFDEMGDTVSEPGVARLVSRQLPEGHSLVLASSMPVRDADAFAVADGPPATVFANRGASGIDGTVATTAGVVMGTGLPATLLIGDLALLHDLNSLAMLSQLPAPVTIVVLNNHGGGIFSFLPIADHQDVFEPFFGTPHDHSFQHPAALFGLEYTRAETADAFASAYTRAATGAHTTVIEVVTDRRENHALHRDIALAVDRAIGARQ